MKLSLRKLFLSQNAINQLLTLEFKPVIAYTLTKNIRAINAELEAIEQGRQQIINSHTVDGELTGDALGQANAEFDEFLDTETDIELKPISINGFKSDVSPQTLMAVEFMIGDEDG